MIRLRTLASVGVLGAALLVGCKIGPDYERPEYPVPGAYRGVEGEAPPEGEASFGDVPWFQAFGDPVLQELIYIALEQNYDVRLAAERVIAARALVTITNADRLPDLQVAGAFESARATENGANPIPPGFDPEAEEWQIVGDLSWEIDFWGRVARATEAARAELLGTELARRTVIQTLVADLAVAYFDLLSLDAELEISRRTYESRKGSYDLVVLRLEQGVANRVELRQSEGLVLRAGAIIPDLEQRIQQQENLIQVLIGANPDGVRRGAGLLEQDRLQGVPVGLPSDLLQRRPDVLFAEQSLVAANARIGEARARLYPSIRLTAVGGLASGDLSDLFDADSRTWSIVPSVVQPIFNAGRLRSNVEVAESEQRQALLAYMQVLQQAFREVADALIAREKRAEVRDWLAQLEAALGDQVDLSRERYVGGVTSYLEVLDSERDHFDAELSLVRAIRDELFAYVRLYRALGGGWQHADELAAAGPQEWVPETTDGPEDESADGQAR